MSTARERFDVIVVGLGAMGSSAGYHLARRGARVLGLEQFDIPNSMGSSHGDSRIIRLCYYEHPDYVPLLRRALELWRALEQESGQTLLHMTGAIYMGRESSSFIVSTLRAAQQHDLPHQLLSNAAVRSRFPQFRLPRDHVGIFEPTAGILLPELVVATQAEQALRHGAVLHAHETVERWSADERGVSVQTNRGQYEADFLVLTAGPWSGTLLGDIGVELLVTRQVMGWFWPMRPELFALGRLPVWAVSNADESLFYGFPMLANRPGFKIAHHIRGELADPNDLNRAVDARDEGELRAAIRQVVPDADGPLLSMKVCMYTNSPDSHFIIDRHPRHGRVALACGFSGHGFKFASVIGEVLADLATSGTTAWPAGFLGLSRFAGGAGKTAALPR